MTNLPRVPAKIFAGKAKLEDIGQFGSALTGSYVNTTDINEIQSLPAYEEGWSNAVISERDYPTLEEMNGLQKTFSQQIAYILQKGIAEYNDKTEYYIGDICKAVGASTLYESLIDNNIGNPISDTTKWKAVEPGSPQWGNITGNISEQTDLQNLLNNKADTDLSNTAPSQVFKDMSMGWGMPDYSKAIDIRSLSSYTCPCNGYLALGCYSGALGYKTNLASGTNIMYQISTNEGYSQVTLYPVVKNEVLTRNLNTGSITLCCFVPMKGAETNA